MDFYPTLDVFLVYSENILVFDVIHNSGKLVCFIAWGYRTLFGSIELDYGNCLRTSSTLAMATFISSWV